MTKKGATATAAAAELEISPEEEEEIRLLSETPDDWEFETVGDESPTQVVWQTVGDIFIGQLEHVVRIVPDDGDPFYYLTHRGRNGALYAIGLNYKILQVLFRPGLKRKKDGTYYDIADGKVVVLSDSDLIQPPGTWVRYTYVKDVDTGQPAPMKDLKVDVRRK